MEIAGALIFVALFMIGYFPMQRLRSRRAAVISGILGLALLPIGVALLKLNPGILAITIFVFWMMLAGIAMTLGSGVRFYILGRVTLSHRDRQIITVILGVALCILMVAGFRFLGTALD